MQVDIVIITALEKELKAILRQGEWEEFTGSQDSIRTYYLTENNAGFRIAAVMTSGMGPVHAAVTASDAVADLSPKTIILVGIAAAISKEIKFGDIVVSEQVIDYDLAKVTDEKVEYRFRVYNGDAALLACIRAFQNEDWKKNIMVPRPDRSPTSELRVHPPGDIYSGSKVVADSNFVPTLLNHFPKAIATEMESAGVASALIQKKHPPGFIMIKGICDRANPEKNDLWQEYAADVAASYAMAFTNTLREGYTSRVITVVDIQKQIRRVIDFATANARPVYGFQPDLAEKIACESAKEIYSVMSSSYRANLDHGRQFLMRAGPIFEKAKAIYATSLDTVSTFWTNPDNREAAREYLKHQEGRAMRLFVFSDADSAHKHAMVLDAHEKAYGRVFICSMGSYWAILRLIAASSSAEALIDRDFAVLRYEQGERIKHLFAELDEQTLDSKDIPDLDVAGEIDYKKFVRLFEQAETIEHGELGTKFNLFRWSGGWWQNRERWAEVLRKLFDERESDVMHLVGFDFEDKSEAQIREILANIKGAILKDDHSPSMKKAYGIKHVWFGRRKTCVVKDHLHQGLLKMADESLDPYILAIQFNTEDGLRKFYEDEEHALLRKNLYEQFDVRLHQLYKTAEAERGTKAGAIIGESIEAMSAKYMIRRDYQNDEMIREMVKTTTPYLF